jgi:3-hydroxyacyl-[acyl-carrier-protein] dehydratase
MPDSEILELLPHRDPFVFVDQILEWNDAGLTAQRVIREDEDFFRGHYPHQPIMPGVLLCECIFQTGALFLAKTLKLDEEQGPQTPVVTRINNVRLRSPVLPGDTLTLQASLVERVKDVFFMKGSITRDGKRVVTLDFACTLLNKPL